MVRLWAVLLALLPAAGQADCRQALVLGLDISGSVSTVEYRMQLDGLAGALNDSAVRQAILAVPDAPVDLFVFEWSGPHTQHVILPWTTIRDEATLDAAIQSLGQTQRASSEMSTAIGQAMLFAADALATRGHCWRRTIDISGDGTSNVGPRPREVKTRLAPDITINALVVAAPQSEQGSSRDGNMAQLSDYYRSEVIVGPDAFVEPAYGFEDFQSAMTRKLLKELQTLTIGEGPHKAQ